MSDRKPGQPSYWRSLEQRAGTPEAQKHAAQEFSDYDPNQITKMPRRRFMQVMGSGMALAGLATTGCRRWPEEKIVPSTVGLRGQMPGEFLYYATSHERNGVGEPLMITSSDGRPIKIEGNGRHPLFATYGKQTYGIQRKKNADGTEEGMVIGGSDIYAQASLLDMYDPSRSSSGVLVRNGADAPAASSNWDAFLKEFAGAGSAGIAVLAEAHSGLAYQQLRAAFLAKYPSALWAEYEPLGYDVEQAGITLAFGPNKPMRALYNLKDAQTIVSLDADLVGAHPAKIRHASDWAEGRRRADPGDHDRETTNRMYIAETTMSPTGAVADHRLPIKPSRLIAVAMGLAAQLKAGDVAAPTDLTEAEKKWIAGAAKDLSERLGVVAAGLQAPQEVQALAHAINAKMSYIGQTVRYVSLPADASKGVQSIANLREALDNGRVATLLILGGNPVFDAPADFAIGKTIKGAKLSAHLSHYDNETSRVCKYHLPRSHYLECWGDNRAFDGTILTQQPQIEPLFDSRSTIELLAMLVDDADFKKASRIDGGAVLVRRAIGLAGDDKKWLTALHTGFLEGSAYANVGSPTAQSVSVTATTWKSDFELRFLPSTLYDGRYANNAWLLEVPDSITKLVWDNAALVNKHDADTIGVKHGDMVSIKHGNAMIEIPIYVLWGQPRGVIGLQLGWGRTAAGAIGSPKGSDNPCGFDVYPVRTSTSRYYAFNDVEVKPLGKKYELISTQDFQSYLDEGELEFPIWPANGKRVGMHGFVDRVGNKGKSGRTVREGTLEEYKNDDEFAQKAPGWEKPKLVQLYDAPLVARGKRRDENDTGAPEFFNTPHAWGMSIDMTSCIGCTACIVACQAENNIPTVGKDMVRMNREMHWLRIDRYFKAQVDENVVVQDYENVDIVFMPMMCVQCENAPCEQVCPVAATVHDTEGLNTMVYNRCIGTRYCSNNCPYKARRFNYFDFHSRDPRGGFLNSMWINIPDTQQDASVAQVKRLVYNPEVTVRMRGVMEKCTYCTQRIKGATIPRKNQFARGERDGYFVDDYDIVTACMQACPTQAIVFGDLQNKNSHVRQLHKLGRGYWVLEDLNTRPRTKFLARVKNPSKAMA